MAVRFVCKNPDCENHRGFRGQKLKIRFGENCKEACPLCGGEVEIQFDNSYSASVPTFSSLSSSEKKKVLVERANREYMKRGKEEKNWRKENIL